MKKVSSSSDSDCLKASLCEINSKINVRLKKNCEINPKSLKEMTSKEFEAYSLEAKELNELFMKQKAIENQIAALKNKKCRL